MRNILTSAFVTMVVLVAAAFGALHVIEASKPDLVEMQNSTVVLDSGVIYCAGLALPGNIVVTAAHCMQSHEDFPVTANDLPVELLWLDKEKDFALLKVEGLEAPPATVWCKDPELGDELWIFGTPAGFSVVMTHATVARQGLEEGMLVVATNTYLGNSGGPVFDKNGIAIGLMSKGLIYRGYPMAYGLVALFSSICDDERFAGLSWS